MKKFLSVLCILVFVLNSSILAYATVEVPDVFGDNYVEFDANVDGYFNIRDLVRIKKYISGMPVIVNMNAIDSNLGDAQLLASMRQELMMGERK